MENYKEVESPNNFIEEMTKDWECSMESRLEHLSLIQDKVAELHDVLPMSKLRDYLDNLCEELGNKINYYSEM